jgi:D-arabinose 1-dehydrogenase-like Zn-dependent alcohol dehydrogenase
MPAALDCMNIHGVYVGSRSMFAELLSFIEQHAIEPIIDRVFEFDEVKIAYQYLASQAHLGKVVIRIGQ